MHGDAQLSPPYTDEVGLVPSLYIANDADSADCVDLLFTDEPLMNVLKSLMIDRVCKRLTG